jgi:hypothetical protein
MPFTKINGGLPRRSSRRGIKNILKEKYSYFLKGNTELVRTHIELHLL